VAFSGHSCTFTARCPARRATGVRLRRGRRTAGNRHCWRGRACLCPACRRLPPPCLFAACRCAPYYLRMLVPTLLVLTRRLDGLRGAEDGTAAMLLAAVSRFCRSPRGGSSSWHSVFFTTVQPCRQKRACLRATASHLSHLLLYQNYGRRGRRHRNRGDNATWFLAAASERYNGRRFTTAFRSLYYVPLRNSFSWFDQRNSLWTGGGALGGFQDSGTGALRVLLGA